MVKVIKKGELRQSMEQVKKPAPNVNKAQTGASWLQVAKENLQAQKQNDIVLRFALFGR